MVSQVNKLMNGIFDLLKDSKWWCWTQNTRFLLDLKIHPEAKIGIAEGDSWFDYRFTSKFIHRTGEDLIGHLCDGGELNVFRLSFAGDTLENMAAEPQMSNFGKFFEIMKKSEFATPNFVMFSAGGNDMAGQGGKYLKTILTSTGLDEAKVNEKIAGMMNHYRTLIRNVRVVDSNLPVFLHGYAYPVPDGRGIFDVHVDDPDIEEVFPGPWLKPAFEGTQISEADQQDIVSKLIDRFNQALESLTKEFDHVIYVDLRNCLPKPPYQGYRDDWANELHPTSEGFRKIAMKMKQKILDELN